MCSFRATDPCVLETINITQPLLVYIPVRNCRDTILQVLAALPVGVEGFADVLVLDNCSEDGTPDVVLDARERGLIPQRLHLVQPCRNVGYAGSQKIAYSIACHAAPCRWVAMVHGDGQYPPHLLSSFVGYMASKYGSVYGYRSKWHYPHQEETPFFTWLAIRTLSVLESAITGVRRREWHSGFVMHSTRLLRKLDLAALTDTPHIDGHLLFASAVAEEPVIGIPIYKLYKALTAFEGAARRRYVLDVLRLMFSFHQTRQQLLRGDGKIREPEELAGGPVRVLGLP
jgi:glycosyltransferase involved in cell wall biosynthesis